MGRTTSLFTYKMRFFFGPSLRGRLGPLAYAGLVAIFVPSGIGLGVGLAMGIAPLDNDAAVLVLAAPLATLLAIGLLYSLGPGVTAHASEFDFFLTADIRPRQYLLSDILFQFTSIFAAGGLATVVAVLAMVSSLGRPLEDAIPIMAILVAFAALVLMASQVLVILRVRHPKAPVRSVTVVLMVVSLLPAISLAAPALPLAVGSFPLPSVALAGLAVDVLRDRPLDLVDLGVASAYVGGVAAAWAALSRTYIFHGIRPTMSAGFGQIDMGSRMEMQRRMIGGLGRVTTRVRLRTDRGSETGLMARLHIVRIWRDGSVLFVGLFAVVAVLPAALGGAEAAGASTISVTQALLFLQGILAMNWAFYERENLWVVLTGSGSPGAYFRGLMLALAAIGLGTSLAFVGILFAMSRALPSLDALGLTIASPIAAATVATAMLTRVKLKPAAFSFAALAIFFLVSLGGFFGGLAAQGVVILADIVLGLAEVLQASLLAGFVVGLTVLGMVSVTRLAGSFRL